MTEEWKKIFDKITINNNKPVFNKQKTKTHKLSHSEYMKSPLWKALRRRFHKEYDGEKMICQVSLSKIIGSPELHHIKYPLTWAADSICNVIMVSRESHQWIHDNLLKRDYTSKEQALNHIQFEYFKQNDARSKLSQIKTSMVDIILMLKED